MDTGAAREAARGWQAVPDPSTGKDYYWNARTGAALHTYRSGARACGVFALAPSADDAWLALGLGDARVWFVCSTSRTYERSDVVRTRSAGS